MACGVALASLFSTVTQVSGIFRVTLVVLLELGATDDLVELPGIVLSWCASGAVICPGYFGL